MNCPKCKTDNNGVKAAYVMKDGEYKRYRHCFNCGSTFRTIERVYTQEEVNEHKRKQDSDMANKRHMAKRINRKNGVVE